MHSRIQSFVRHFSVKMPFYSVARGRKTGVFLTWPECEAQVKGFIKPIFKKFPTYAEAQTHCLQNGGSLNADGHNNRTSATPYPIHVAAVKRSFASTFPTPSASSSAAIEKAAAKRTRLIDLPQAAPGITQMKQYGIHYFLEDADGFVHVYTDGSCEGNGRDNAVAGLGVYFAEGHPLNTAKPVSGRATNNCGEIQAASEAIRLALAQGIRKLCINTDSQFVINSATKWMDGWVRKDWKRASGLPVKNELDFKELHGLMQTHELKIKWNYVQAHCGILGNERADVLAKEGGQMYKAQQLSQQ